MRKKVLLLVASLLLIGFFAFSIRFQHFVQSGISMLAASGGVLLTVTVGAPPSNGGGGSSSNSGNNSTGGGGGGGGGGSLASTNVPQVVKQQNACNVIGDVNGDGKVNLTDFSILAYWYKRTLTPSARLTVDLNHDGKVSLVDFSILAYYWNKTICASTY